ncbi:MAG: hypothetical protein IE916_03715 [Epsilonproteobacteria bacterium]|nr:hypothetical protein [Campylobacterota bacterium]
MREKKIKIVVGMLLALVLFTSSAALLMYLKQDRSAQKHQESVTIYVAAKAIESAKRISADDLAQIHMPKEELRFTPLDASEIIGMYLNDEMYAGEIFRAEKLSLSPKEQERAEIEPIQNEPMPLGDSIVVNLSAFQNMDATLKSGDFIDIVSVMPTQNKNREYEFSPKYIALHVGVLGINYEEVASADKKGVQRVAKSIVISMKPNEIKAFLDLYYSVQNINAQRYYNEQNRGHLWMVKCSTQSDDALTKSKEALLLDAKPKSSVIARSEPKRHERVSIAYEE